MTAGRLRTEINRLRARKYLLEGRNPLVDWLRDITLVIEIEAEEGLICYN
ncbi:hypothetical protein ZMO02_15990 [Zymomonas mobilis subsp. pomaceae]|nr:hypothetical protein ZMO02_15990 [Zymomonas mobilis subsp. pomaceae]